MHKYLYFLLIYFLGIQSFFAQQKITIYWDTSLSMKDKNIIKEFDLLENYFNNLQDIEVKLISFSNSINSNEIFNITSADWSSLKSTLLNTKYDGVAFFDILSENHYSDVNLLFTDGIEIIDKLIVSIKKPTFIINSSKTTNHKVLNKQSIISQGKYINLNTLSTEQGLVLLNLEIPKIIDTKANKVNKNKISSLKVTPDKKYIKGVVYGSEGILVGATIKIKGKPIGVVTNANGEFNIKVIKSDVLVISYSGRKTKEVLIDESNNIEVLLITNESELDEIVVTGKGKREPEMVETGFGRVNKEKLGYEVRTISDKELMSGNASNISDALRGKMGSVDYDSGKDLSQVIFRNGYAGVLAHGMGMSRYALIIIDGVPLRRTTSEGGPSGTNKLIDNFVNTENIAKVTILKGLAATNIYGSEGAGGVILITTKTSLAGIKSKKPYDDRGLLRNNIYTENLTLVNNSIKNIAFIKEYEKYKTLTDVYSHYLKQRVKYLNDPLYFTNVSDYMLQWGNKELSSKILSNILEINPNNAEVLRFVAYKAEQKRDLFFAKRIYEKIAELKPKEAQSYKDLALIYQKTGYYQKALDIYNNIKNDKYTGVNFSGLEKNINNEMRRLILLHKKELNLMGVANHYLNDKKLEYDARIVFDWNKRNTDFELQFVNPQKKFFTWSHTQSQNISRFNDEDRYGFNSEEFLLIDAAKGAWQINIESKVKKGKLPVVVKYTVYRNFGKKNETVETRVLILNKIKEKQMIGKIII